VRCWWCFVATQSPYLITNPWQRRRKYFLSSNGIWQIYTQDKLPDQHTIVGSVRIALQIYSPQLNNSRDILVYLPPSYFTSEKRYPVVYMHDGQNLFDEMTSHVGEWHVDENMEAIASSEGLEAIIVGIPNHGAERMQEYSPYDTRWGKSKAAEYIAFITDTIKPLVDSSFRTLPNRETTGIAGSSMGGLISFYAFLRSPYVFGLVGAMSPSFWLVNQHIQKDIENAQRLPGRIYLDIGGQELSWRRGQAASKQLTNTVKNVYDALIAKGYRPNREIAYIQDPEGVHHEAAWAKRFPQMIRFFLSTQPELVFQEPRLIPTTKV
jgi:predicted alpha/beta superfamily hydrolase